MTPHARGLVQEYSEAGAGPLARQAGESSQVWRGCGASYHVWSDRMRLALSSGGN